MKLLYGFMARLQFLFQLGDFGLQLRIALGGVLILSRRFAEFGSVPLKLMAQIGDLLLQFLIFGTELLILGFFITQATLYYLQLP